MDINPNLRVHFQLPEINLRLSEDWYERSRNEFRNDLNPEFQGPLDDSNWLIPGILLVGGYPASGHGDVWSTNFYQRKLLEAGITTFVCLNNEYGENETHPAYAEKKSYGRLFGTEGLPSLSPRFNKDLNFIHFPIKDMDIRRDNTALIKLCIKIHLRINKGERIYIHCSGGHGRTGTIAAILLCMLYDITPDDAFEYIQYSHDQRKTYYPNFLYNSLIGPNDCNNGKPIKSLFQLGQVPTPQTTVQRHQVRTVIQYYRTHPNEEYEEFINEQWDEIWSDVPEAPIENTKLSPNELFKGGSLQKQKDYYKKYLKYKHKYNNLQN